MAASRFSLFIILFIGILSYFSLPSIQAEFKRAYNFDLTWNNLQNIYISDIDWKFVGGEIWRLVDPRMGYKRGEWFGRVLRERGPEVVRQVRERLDL